MPLDVRHDDEGQPTDHREIHNVYGMLDDAGHLRRACAAAAERAAVRAHPRLLRGRPALLRLWPGDNISDLGPSSRDSIPMLTGMGLSGLSFVGSDIGGFAGAPSAELYTRWLQAGVFYPFMRTHSGARHARPGAVVVRNGARGDQPRGDRAALPAAAAHLQRDGGGERDRRCRRCDR